MEEDKKRDETTEAADEGKKTDADDAESVKEGALPPEPRKNRFVAFLKGYAGVLGAIGALLAVAALVLIAVMMDGDLYDKAAFFWIIAFLAELVYYKLARPSKGTLVAILVTAALGVAFVVLYALELKGILP